MKAAVLPEWELRDVPIPRPGPGEVLIKVHASGICFNDVLAGTGVLPFPSVRPAITGHEPAGEIVEIGPGVRTREVGDNVGATWVQGTCGRCDYCLAGRPVSGQAALNCASPVTTGFSVQGGHAEYLVALASGTVLLPDGLPFEHAAPVLCAGYTALSALHAAGPRPDDRVAVVGIGAVGHMALQYAHAMGLRTVAVTHSPGKHHLARELGADDVVGNGEQLRDINGADIVLATGSSYQAASDSLRGLRVNGRLVLTGLDSGSGFDIAPAKPLFTQRHQIIGATHGGPERLREALDLVADGRCTPMVEVFPATQISEAVRLVGDGDVRFRAVVTF